MANRDAGFSEDCKLEIEGSVGNAWEIMTWWGCEALK